MSEDVPNFDEYDKFLPSFLPAFATAKWITGLNVVTPDSFHYNFTDLGKKRMRQLNECCKVLYDWGKRPVTDEPELASKLAMFKAIQRELRLFDISDEQMKVLHVLAVCHVRKWDAEPPIPPGRGVTH